MSSSAAPSYEPRHIIYVFFPDARLVCRDFSKEDFILPPVRNSKGRHDPVVPMIEGRPTDNSYHGLRADIFNEIFSVTKASPKRVYYEQQPINHYYGAKRLMIDMQATEKSNGTTRLFAFTYMPKISQKGRNGGREVTLRLLRESNFCFVRSSTTRHFTYDFPIADLDALVAPNEETAEWLTNLKDLIWRRADAAFVHVLKALRAQNFVEDDPEWKPTRQPNYKQALQHYVVPPTSLPDEEDFDCPICLESMRASAEQTSEEDASEEIVMLPCKRHYYHTECLVLVAESNGATKAKCPMDKTPIFQDDEDFELLKHGTIGQAYVVDHRFSKLENYERSLADVDKKFAKNDKEKIKISWTLLPAIFDKLINGAPQEPASSSGSHIQFARSSEIGLLEQAIKSASKEMHGMEMTVSEIFRAIFLDLNNNLLGAVSDGFLVSTFSQKQLKRATKNPAQVVVEQVRPDFVNAAAKIISRVCEFARVRPYRCDPGAFHSHGIGACGRYYYNPDAEEWARPIPVSPLLRPGWKNGKRAG